MCDKKKNRKLNLLVMSDLHYDPIVDSPVKKRQARLGVELLRRVRKSMDCSKIDLIIVLGDLINMGDSEYSKNYLLEIKKELGYFAKDYLVIPGNHDGDIEDFYEVFEEQVPKVSKNGYQIISFSDVYNKEGICVRDFQVMEDQFKDLNEEDPIILLQHNTVLPLIGDVGGYDYDMEDALKVSDIYEKNKVLLSLSGHYHPGVKSFESGDVTYMVVPSLCESPFRFWQIQLDEREMKLREHQLLLNDHKVCDYHIHTPHAYCSHPSLTVAGILERHSTFDIKKMGLLEHGPQLYLPEEVYWSGEFVNDPKVIDSYKETSFNRMKAYKEDIAKFRSEKIAIGLEVEVDVNGDLCMLEEDIGGWDYFIGAIHYLPCKYDKAVDQGFMWVNEQLMKHDIQILGHPFRYYRRKHLPIPRHLFEPLAQLLSMTGTAVEVNYHGNEPELDFFKLCYEKGVKIALSSDTHEFAESGAFIRHYDFLRQFIPELDLEQALYKLEKH